jgi:hypothetical protein
VQADGSWSEQFPGQRPPFEPGNQLSVRHGAYSPAIVGPLAEQIAADLLGDKDCPEYLRRPLWRWAVSGWAHAEAEAELMRRWRAQMSAADAATEVLESDEDEERPSQGTMTRRVRGKRVQSSADMLHRAETRAAHLRARLGLDPLSAARLRKDVAAPEFNLAKFWEAQYRAEQGG